MPEAADIPGKEKGFFSHMLLWFGLLFALLALYVLSIGPVVKLVWTPGVNRTPGVQMMQTFYAPLSWVCENNGVARDFVTWYLQQVWGIR